MIGRVLLDRTQWEPALLDAMARSFPSYPVRVAWLDDTLFGIIYMLLPDGEPFHGVVGLSPHEANNVQVDKPSLLRTKAGMLHRTLKKKLNEKGVRFTDCIPITREAYDAVTHGKAKK